MQVGVAAFVLITVLGILLFGNRKRRSKLAEKSGGLRYRSFKLDLPYDTESSLSIAVQAIERVGGEDIVRDGDRLLVRGWTRMTFARPALELTVQARPLEGQPDQTQLVCVARPKLVTVVLTFGAESAILTKLETAIRAMTGQSSTSN